LKKKAKNELIIFEEFKLDDCKTPPGKGLVQKKCVCYRHGALYEFKQFIRNDAINTVSFEIRKNGQKAYEFKKEELAKRIKKQESRIRKKYRFKLLRLGLLSIIGIPYLN
jgi:hypothetical protein